MNPCSAASWRLAREAYSALTQAEKDRLELAAAQSKDTARKARRELQDRRQQPQQQHQQQQQQLALPPAPDTRAGAALADDALASASLATMPVVDRPSPATSVTLLNDSLRVCQVAGPPCQHTLESLAQPAPEQHGHAAAPTRPVPMAADVLNIFMTQDRADGTKPPGRRVIEEEWRQLTQSVVNSEPFPDTVAYPACCGCFCVSRTSQRVLHLQKQFMKKLAWFAKEASGDGKAGNAVKADAIFIAELFDESSSSSPFAAPVSQRFFALTAAAGRQAHHPDNQMFLELAVERGQAQTTYVCLCQM